VINPNRLQFVVSIGLFALGVASWQFPARWQAFRMTYEEARRIEYVERESGMIYRDWYDERVRTCNDQIKTQSSLKALDPPEDRDQFIDGCINGVTIDQVVFMQKDEMRSYLINRVLVQLAAITALALAASYLIVRGIPRGSSQFLKWLRGGTPK
jgi:hypothetical protein